MTAAPLADPRISVARLREAVFSDDYFFRGEVVPLMDVLDAAHALVSLYYGDFGTSLAKPRVEQAAHHLTMALARFDFGKVAV